MTYQEYLRAVSQGYSGHYVPDAPATNNGGAIAGSGSGGANDPWALGGVSNQNNNSVSGNTNTGSNAGNPLNITLNTGASGDNSSVSAPWAPAQPYILDLMRRGQEFSNQFPGVDANMSNAFTGMQGANNTALTNQAQGVIGSTLGSNPANYYGVGFNNSGSAGPSQVTSATNPFLGMNNPYLTQAIDNASQDATRNMTGMFNQQNRASGSFGNSGLAEYQSRTAADTLGNIATNARMGDYNSQMNLAQQNVQNQNQMGQFNASNQMANNQFNANLQNQTQALRNQQYNTGFNAQNNAAFNAPQFNAANMGNYGSLYNTAANMNQANWMPLQNYGALLGSGFGTTQTTNTSTNPWLTGAGLFGLGSSIYSNIFGGG